MKTNVVLELIGNQEFLDKIYQFAYRRCDTSFEAEDLCSEIIVAVISGIQKQEMIESFYGFVWSIARRVYADYSEHRNRMRQNMDLEEFEMTLESKRNEIEDLIEARAEYDQLKAIWREIAFLSKAYREVMIMYYIDEVKIGDIACKLQISENTVKQRLFSARNIVRREVESMNSRNLSLKPIELRIIGMGSPVGNDPRVKLERSFSKNLVYLCKDKPKSVKELAEELCMPMMYIEEELEIQCRGENWNYGMLRKLNNGKYALNVLLVDYEESVAAKAIYEKYLPEFCERLKVNLQEDREKILGFPYLSPQKDINLVLWLLIQRFDWKLSREVKKILQEKYFSDIEPVKREFSVAGIAFRPEQEVRFDFYGCDGNDASMIGGYQQVHFQNMYGNLLDPHFHCGHNISQDEKLLMVLRSIGGLNVEDLTEVEKEIAAKAIECGYLRKNGTILEPKIVVLDGENESDFMDLAEGLVRNMDDIIDKIAKELAVFMRNHIPEHLMNEFQLYESIIAGESITPKMIEEMIKEGIMKAPEHRLDAEGVLMFVCK